MIKTVHLHLILNHWPIIVPMLGFLLVAIASLRGSEPTGRVGLAFLVGGAVALLPAYFTGEGAEHSVRRAPGVTEMVIDQHADAALWGVLVLGAVGGFALWSLWRFRAPGVLPRWVLAAALGGSLLASTVMARVGLLGGQIRHSEVRANPPAAFGTGTSGLTVPSAPTP